MTSTKPGQLRIIGGAWRSRKIPFASFAGVRPTSDRVRETLFNWLQTIIPGARCLDLFSGSGALGFEALSRGAAEVVMVDQDLRVIQQLQQNVELLKTNNARVVWSDAMDYLSGVPSPFDVVFLDPPYRDDIVSTCCQCLEDRGWLAPDASIYLEMDSAHAAPQLPANWQLLKDKSTGNVAYRLAQRQS